MIPYFQITEFSIGPVSFQAWGTMVALGLLAGIFIAYQETKRRKRDPNRILDLSFWIILSSFLGARIFYVIGNLDLYLKNPISIFKIWEGGMTIFGGLVGALIAYLIFLKKKKIYFWDLADPIVFALPFGIFLGRIGCFLIHDHIGKITTVPWGIQYLDGTIRHETTLYNGLSALVLFIIFLVLRRFPWSQKKGFYVASFMIWYGISRFITDFFRAEDLPISDHRWLGLTINQYVSILLFLGGICLFKKLLIRQKQTNEQEN
ncbi:MAG: prolipoprotein diacylglyceryl transferase [Candidatus Kerfeldbacteria bacterium CG08_land_8_20_14_0_20_40_16]|uniref:Phosphatidylglycerol--prolipoprotein diacylglyceryl transferase n=1 Tax=Candidatus Kerfeldbacteria bacterium CG08_land_8_20_14_0_20_40_16 TaxID=2014244 RepID=A0A2H0YVY9_9BACT|nr:MAG: prolipoprotein diacylglyceryl transferase [Candidatus Kerfeldbacteria bacterium CG08_land_8_20_14_0_20_40_16]